MSLRPGDPAPEFSLPPGPGPDRVTLSEFQGKDNVVLLFFPLAFSSVCHDELCQVAERWPEAETLGARVLAISVDSPFVVQRFAEETGVSFPILSDFNKEAITAYDVKYEDFFGSHGVAKRSAFVVDKAGTVRYAWVTEDADVLPYFAAIREVVEALA